MDEKELIRKAKEARNFAKAMYSHFQVGAALECQDGAIFTGCNVESSSYGLTICAERVALVKALSEGKNAFSRIAIVADTDRLTPPCGACRQLLYDYAPELQIIIANIKGDFKIFSMREIYPEPFGPDFL